MGREKVDLEQILKKYENHIKLEGEQDYFKHDVLRAMKEACLQTLELAAENAKIVSGQHPDSKYDPRPVFTYDVDKQSILDMSDLIN